MHSEHNQSTHSWGWTANYVCGHGTVKLKNGHELPWSLIYLFSVGTLLISKSVFCYVSHVLFSNLFNI